MGYRHLTEGERYQIEALLRAMKSPAEIARQLGHSKSTICRELARNSSQRVYRAAQADRCYRQRLVEKGRERQCWHLVFDEVAVPLLAEGWSPEQISGFYGNSDYAVSHEWLYQRILRDKQEGGRVYRHLRCQRRRKKRYGKPERRGQIVNRRSIDERPKEVEARSRIGDWEADTIIGTNHRGAVVSLVERKTGYAKLIRVPSKEAAGVTQAINKALRPFKEMVLTITFDNGKEFAGHEKIAKVLKADCYFADPYSSWQRGSNENLNGLVRQYFPKKSTDFTQVTDAEIAEVERKLNNRPRKRLGWKTPAQVFSGKSLNLLTY